MTPDWTIKGEYLHYDLGRVSYLTTSSMPIFGANIAYTSNVSVTSVAHFGGDIIRTGLNFKFE